MPDSKKTTDKKGLKGLESMKNIPQGPLKGTVQALKGLPLAKNSALSLAREAAMIMPETSALSAACRAYEASSLSVAQKAYEASTLGEMRKRLDAIDDTPQKRMTDALGNTLLKRLTGDIDSTSGLSAALNIAPYTPSQPSSHRINSASDLGVRVRTARKAIDMTQQEFADLAGVGRRFISELEGGKPTLEFDRVLKVCQAAGIDIFAKPRGS